MADIMTFPNTWDEFEQLYGITDTEEIYTNGSRLIPSFRVKQWLDHIAQNTDLSDFCDRLWRSAYNRGYERCKQDAIDEIKNLATSMSVCVSLDECKGMKSMQERAINVLESLPSAQPEVRTQMSSADCIRRQDAVDLLEKWSGGYDYIETETESAIKELCDLPSAQLDITLESAVDYLQSIGWMQEHDRIISASAQPERKGKWIEIQDEVFASTYRCSNCGMSAPESMTGCLVNRHLEPNRTNFCPNCGSYNGGEEE